jgi:hypothetical protein
LNAESLFIESVKKGLNELISRYSVLRTAFKIIFSELPHVVYKSVEGNFSYEKITKK